METRPGSLPESTHSESRQGLTDRLKQDGRQQLDSRKRSAADQIDEIAHAIGRAGEHLQSQPRLAAYTDQIAASVSNLATRIRDGSVEQLADDARQLARRNPGLFVLGGFAAGVALARFLKASGREPSGEQFSSDFAQAGTTLEGEEYAERAYSSASSAAGRPDESSSAAGRPGEPSAAGRPGEAGVEQVYPSSRSDGG